MIEFVCGRAGSGKSEYVADRIRSALAASGDPLTGNGKKIYLIVPEQQAVVWESRAARTFPPKAALQFEIVNFSRLCNLVARTYGGLTDNYITRGGKAALMWSTLASLSDSLHVYGGSTRPERAAPLLLAAVSEMKRCGITPADLAEAASRLAEEEESRPLARRTEDLALISAAYQHLLNERYTDDEDDLAHLAMRLKEEPFFAGADVFVDSFFSLTAVENEILYHIFRQADNVCVTFACPPSDTGEAQFASPRSFLAAMRRAADRAHRDVTLTSLTENRRAQAAELAYLEENLWKFDAPSFEGDVSAIRLIEAADRYGEADAAVCRIEELLRSGARCADIALIARDASRLRGILDTALERADIPCFFSENADAAGRPASRLLLGALAVAGGGFRREDVILCAKTGLCSLTDDECDALEMYTDTWHIRGLRAFGSPWNMNPDGYVAQMTPRGEKLLSYANAARDKLIPPLEAFASVFTAGSATVPEICRACYEFLCTCGVWDALRDSSAALHAAGRLREASEQSQLWDVLMEALDTLAEALPQARADAASFSALLRQVLSAARIGSIPGGTDEVVIGSADQVRLGEVKHVILLGAVDSEFPGSPAEGGFFSDTDKIRLEGEGILLSSGTDERMKEELFWFYRAAALPHDSLTVLIPRGDGGTPLSPSLAAERIRTLFPSLKIENSAAWTADKTVWRPADACAQARLLRGTEAGIALRSLGALSDAVGTAIPLSGKNEKVSAETAAILFPRDIPLTQSRMDSFVLCRFGYYCRYVMKLEEKKEASLSAVSAGTFLHRVLELYFTRTAGEGFPLPPTRMNEEAEKAVADVVSEICPPSAKNGRSDYLFTRLKRCVLPVLRALDAEFAQSAFRPAAFELSMGTGDGSIPSMPVPTGNGHTVHLRGTVDRLDTWRNGEDTYIRVVDYKTGSKKFAREDISVGVNVQLLLYLFSILRCPPGEFRRSLTGKRDGSIRAAGALYFSMRPGSSTSDVLISAADADRQVQDDILRTGVLLADEDVLRAMEPDLAGKFIPAKAKKEGFSSSAAVSEAELEELERITRESIARVGSEMCTGGAEAQPKKLHNQDPCTWCAMKDICRTGGRKNESEEQEGS